MARLNVADGACAKLQYSRRCMANLASVVWQDASTALLLGVHGAATPSDAEWQRYCDWIPGLLAHPNAGCIVLTDGGAPNSQQRERMRKQLGTAGVWTAVVTDKALVRGVVTAIRWFNPKICAFAPWELREAFKFVGVDAAQSSQLCAAFKELDAQLAERSRVLSEALTHLESLPSRGTG
jgi:hypothetical protein